MNGESRPSGGTRTAELAKAATKFTAHGRVNGYAAPTAEDRADFDLLAEAQRRGYRLTCRCLDCRRWLADPVSIAAMRGPVCRARAGVA